MHICIYVYLHVLVLTNGYAVVGGEGNLQEADTNAIVRTRGGGGDADAGAEGDGDGEGDLSVRHPAAAEASSTTRAAAADPDAAVHMNAFSETISFIQKRNID